MLCHGGLAGYVQMSCSSFSQHFDCWTRSKVKRENVSLWSQALQKKKLIDHLLSPSDKTQWQWQCLGLNSHKACTPTRQLWVTIEVVRADVAPVTIISIITVADRLHALLIQITSLGIGMTTSSCFWASAFSVLHLDCPVSWSQDVSWEPRWWQSHRWQPELRNPKATGAQPSHWRPTTRVIEINSKTNYHQSLSLTPTIVLVAHISVWFSIVTLAGWLPLTFECQERNGVKQPFTFFWHWVHSSWFCLQELSSAFQSVELILVLFHLLSSWEPVIHWAKTEI